MKLHKLILLAVMLLSGVSAQIPTDSLVAYYPFNGDTNDESGNGNDGTPYAGVGLVTDRFGNSNRAYGFDGVDGYVDLGVFSSPVEGSNDFSISIFIQPSDITLQNYGMPIGTHRTDIYTSGWSIGLNSSSSGAVVFTAERTPASSPWDMSYIINNALSAFTWQHLVITRMGDQFQWYIDGIASGGGHSNSVVIGDGAFNVTLGTAGAVRFFNGLLDDIRIYNRALSAWEVKSLYHEGGWDSNPVLHLDAENGFTDNSLYGNDGTATNVSIVPAPWGGNAYQFSGDGYIEIPDLDNSLDMIGDFTVEMLIDFDDQVFSTILDKGAMISGPKNFTLHYNGTDKDILFGTGPLTSGIIGGLPILAWNKLAIIVKGDSIKGIFNNWIGDYSKVTDLQTSFATNLNDNPLYIGAGHATGGGEFGTTTNNNFFGRIDDIKIHKRTLDPSELQAVPAIPDTTYITGQTITTNTTWTKAESPYVISGDVAVDNGATLTIEPGVEVLFDAEQGGNQGYWNGLSEMDIRYGGQIVAIGTEQDSVSFRGINNVGFDEWGGITVITNQFGTQPHDFLYTVIENAVVGIFSSSQTEGGRYADIDIKHSRFGLNRAGIFLDHNGSVVNDTVSNNIFMSGRFGVIGFSDSAAIFDNSFYNMKEPCEDENWPVPYGGGCTSGAIGFGANYGIINNNYFENCIESVALWGSFDILYNDNGPGISRYYVEDVRDIRLEYNNFNDMGTIALNGNRSNHIVDAKNNWWGINSTSEINTGSNPKNLSFINDHYDMSQLPTVDYSHWLDAPWPGGQPVGDTYDATLLVTDNLYTDEILTYQSGETIYLQVTDPDRDGDTMIPESFTMEVWSELETAAELVTMNETDISTGIFRGSIAIDDASGAAFTDGSLQVNHGDWMYFRYIDPANDWGNVDTVLAGKVFGATVINGQEYSTNVTYQLSQSPYIITGDLVINDTLFIEPGVDLYLRSVSDYIRSNYSNLTVINVFGDGYIYAVGTTTDSISFSSYDDPGSISTWQGIWWGYGQPKGGHFKYCVIQNAREALRPNWIADSLVIENCRLSQNTSYMNDYDSTPGRGKIVIKDCEIGGNSNFTIQSNKDIQLDRNTFIFDPAFSGGSGGSLYLAGYTGHLIARYNNFIGSSGNLVTASSSTNADFRFNYWGVSATAEISTGNNPKNLSAILDGFDDPGKDIINYSHWLDAPWPGGTPAPGGWTGELSLTYNDGSDAWGYRDGDSLFVQLYDPDLNIDVNTPDGVNIEVWSDMETTPEILSLTEVVADSGLFTGWMKLDGSSGMAMTDGVLQADINNWIYTRYTDALDDWNNSNQTVVDSAQFEFTITPYETDANTVLLLHFDEGSGQVVNDASGNGNHGMLGSSSSVGADDPLWVVGVSGSGMKTNIASGTATPVKIPYNNGIDVNGTEITLEGWFYFVNSISSDWFFGRNGELGQIGFSIAGVDLNINLPLSIGGRAYSFNYSLEPDQWYHLAATYDGATVKCYVDGNLVSTIDENAILTLSGWGEWHIGMNHSGSAFINMMFDEVRISNIARTSFEFNDDVPPAAISTLSATNSTSVGVDLQWTAVGDDNFTGTASQYDLRYSTSLITDANFDAATQVAGVPVPAASGTSTNFSVTGLNYATTYYFAIKTKDNVGLWSPISNVISATTDPQDLIAPGTISDLAVGASGKRSVSLLWTAPGDDGATGDAVKSYAVYYSTSTIAEPLGAGVDSLLSVAPLAAGSQQSAEVTGLSPLTTYYFAVRAYDEVPNGSGLSNVIQATTLNVPVLADTPWPSFHGDPQNTGASSLVGAMQDSLMWSYLALGQIASSPVLDASGNIYFGSEDGSIHAVKPDGTARWGALDLGPGISAAPVVGTDGKLYVGSKSNVFYALDQTTGNIAWTDTTGDQIYSSGVISSNGLVYYGSLDGLLRAAQSDDGVEVWSYDTGNKVYNSPALTVDESALFFGTQAGKLIKVDAATGALAWEYNIGSALYSSPAVDSTGVVYVGAQNGHVYAIDAAGSLLWDVATNAGILYSSPTLHYDGSRGNAASWIYIGNDGGRLYALGGADGATRWYYPITAGKQIRNSPLLASNNLIYFGGSDSIFYCIDTDGSLQWSQKVGGPLYISSPALSTTGQLYIGAYDNKLYSLGFLDRFMVALSGLDEGEYSGNIDVGYNIINPAQLPVNLLVEYTLDGGNAWLAAAVIGTTTMLETAQYTGSLTWNSDVTESGIDLPTVQLRITPSDADSIGLAGLSPVFHLDNNMLPTVAVNDVPGEHVGDIDVSFTYADAESDTLTLSGEYQLIGSDIWSAATLIGDIDSLVGTAGLVTWPTLTDLPDSAGLFYLRLFSHDNDPSIPDTIVVHVDNNHWQSIALADLTGEQSGNIAIVYQITDASQDTIDLTGHYQVPGSTAWIAATVTGTMANIAAANYSGSITWNSVIDQPGQEYTGAQFKLTPGDGWALGLADTITFDLDNNAPPVAVIDSIIGEQVGIIPVVFNITDAEVDVLTLTSEFQVLGETTWAPATVTGNVTSVTDYSDTLWWNSDADLTEFIGYLDFRITPADNDPGQPDTILVLVDQVGAPAVVTFSSLQGEQTGDIVLSFTVTDDESDAVDLQLAYSIDGGVNWAVGTISGQTIGLAPANYSGTFIWHSATDLPGEDHANIRLKLTPYDGYWGAYLLTMPFHLDNNMPPVFACTMDYQEVTGVVDVPFTITDAESDAVNVTARFSTDNKATWTIVTTDTQLDGITTASYTGTIAWKSADDLPNIDMDSVWIRFEVGDNDPGTGDIMVLHVDNEIAPAITSVYPVSDGLIYWLDTLVIEFSTELDAASLEEHIQSSGINSGNIELLTELAGNRLSLIPTGAFMADDTVTVSLQGLITDILGVGLDGNGNGDPDGSPTDDYTWSFATTLLGDYDLDGLAAFTDVMLFRDAWFAEPQNIYYELAPYTGQVPNLIVAPDGRLDVLDLAVLARMWNWSINPSLQIERVLTKANDDAAPFILTASYDDNPWAEAVDRDFTIALTSKDNSALTGFELVLDLDPAVLKYKSFVPQGDLAKAKDDWLILDSYNEESGILVLSAVDFSGDVRTAGSALIGQLELEVVAELETDITFDYIRSVNGTGTDLEYGQVKTGLSTKAPLPTSYALHQNFPNPFNPSTTIRYELPQDTRVILLVYDILGREATRLVDEAQAGGYHQIIWNGRDAGGREMASGIYFTRLVTPGYSKVRKMLLLK